ncbi:MAG: cytochrome C oxidase subunit IV family protein [Gemmataceae bacterium]
MAAHKPITPGTYSIVYVALLALTALTVYIAESVDTGAYEIAVALTIASIKTLLVALIFMHMYYSGPLVWLSGGAGILFLAIMMSIMLLDYNTRDWSPGRNEQPIVTSKGQGFLPRRDH